MQALIFDFDGTILNTDEVDFITWEDIYKEYNCTLPIHQWLSRVGRISNNFDPLKYLEAQVSATLNADDILLRHKNNFLKFVNELNPMPGVQRWINTAKKLGLRLAIASNSPRTWVINHLERLKLIHHFEVIASRENVNKLKPNPDIYQFVLNELQILPIDALAIEDSPSGATAAIEAGVKCIIVPNTLTQHMDFPSGFCFVNNLDEILLEDVLAHA